MNEIVYILINEAMPGYVKIGRTSTSVEQRMQELYKTAVPLPFECFYAAKVQDSHQVESALHDAFADNRVSPSREFFQIAPERVVAVLKLLAIEEVTPGRVYTETKEDELALEKARIKGSVFNFEMVKIPVGALLTLARNKGIVCQVVDNRWVSYKGQITSLTAAAKDALNITRPIQGPLYWEYEGELLTDRRRRMEESN
jgi:hypothetical protein